MIVEKTKFSSWLCNQAFSLSSPAFSETQTPSSIHSFFLPDRLTHHHKRRGDRKRNILFDGLSAVYSFIKVQTGFHKGSRN